MMLGMESLAGYQLCINLLIFFILFGEPLSQLGQTKLPSLIDSNRTEEAMATFKSIITLSTFAAGCRGRGVPDRAARSGNVLRRRGSAGGREVRGARALLRGVPDHRRHCRGRGHDGIAGLRLYADDRAGKLHAAG